MEIRKRVKNAIAAFKENETLPVIDAETEAVEAEAEVTITEEPIESETIEDAIEEIEAIASEEESEEDGQDLNAIDDATEEPESLEAEDETVASEEASENEEDEEPEESRKRNVWGLLIIFAIVVLAITAFVFSCDLTADKENANGNTWKMVTGNYDQNRMMADGIKAIRDAKTDDEAFDAANIWLEKVKTDPLLLSAAAGYFLHETVDSSSLVKDGWATEKAVEIYGKLGIALGMATITAEKAPSNGYNSGVFDGKVVTAKNPGISGDRKSIKIVLEDGTILWVMARCGNIVSPEKPNLPEGPTDQKDPTKDVLANKNVDNWKKNSNGEKAVADSNNYQADPAKDAANAAADAKVAADKAAAEADAARDKAVDSGAGVVDSGTGYTEVPDPVVIDPNW